MEIQINPGIFKAYDIRGIFNTDLDSQMAYRIGRALIQYTRAKKISVGYDMRQSSKALEEGLTEGITDQGADVIKLGLCSTPMSYFSSWKLPVDAAVIVTASHNPAEWNGFKLCQKNAMPIGEGNGMEEIRDLAIAGNFKIGAKGKTEENLNFKKEYFDYIAGFFIPDKGKKKIIVDFANAMGSLDKEIYDKFPADLEMTYLYDNLDGTFPNHEANPLKTETLAILQKNVMEMQADLGIAYDGDADRVGFVDEKGEIVRMDFITALLAQEILKKRPGSLILADIRSSNSVPEYIQKVGGRVDYSRIGHSLIKAQMRKEGATFGGELSGHYFFEENSKAEMPTLAAIMIINLLNETGKKMSELVAELKRYYQSGEINSEVDNKDAVMEKLKKKYADGKLNTLDGIRVDYPDWWFNVRPSNTEPKLRLNLEAKTQELMEQKRDEVLSIIRS